MNTIEEIIADIKANKMVILLDDEDRENEGDLIMAAHAITAEHINFMAKYGRGLICMPVSKARADKLGLAPMVANNGSTYSTNFTVSIEAAQGVSTGISCADRAKTILAASNPNATRHDIVQPGHIFPLIAQNGGVLTRPGHTEAAVDLSLLADLGDSAVLVEILNDDGTMARRDDLEHFAEHHQIKIGTIADLIRYRRKQKKPDEIYQSVYQENNMQNIPMITGNSKINSQARIAIIASRFNHFVVDSLVSGAISTLNRHEISENQYDVIQVPGAFELPVLAKRIASSNRYDGIIALGAVIRGATPHFDYVAGTCANGLSNVSTQTGVPIAFGVLTTDTIEQAIERAGTKAGNKGSEACETLLEMLSLFKQLEL